MRPALVRLPSGASDSSFSVAPVFPRLVRKPVPTKTKEEKNMATSKKQKSPASKPVKTIRTGACRTTIWKNQGPDGPFYVATLTRFYRDASGNWRIGTSFTDSQLGDLMNTVRQAREWMVVHSYLDL
jgi:hypothetical protein